MTRAKHWLIVAGAGETNEASWYEIIQKGAQNLELIPGPNGRMRHEFGDWPPDAPEQLSEVTSAALPSFAAELAGPGHPAPKLFKPSDLGGGALEIASPIYLPDPDRLDEPPDEADPLERGTKIHLLIEEMSRHPKDQWSDLAAMIGVSAARASEAMAVLEDPDLAWLFGPGSRAEVDLAAPFMGGYLAGAVDRLVVTPDEVRVIDFKSNRLIPADAKAMPEIYQRQLAAYAYVLGQIYPGRLVRAGVVWTAARENRLMWLSDEQLAAALSRARADAGRAALSPAMAPAPEPPLEVGEEHGSSP